MKKRLTKTEKIKRKIYLRWKMPIYIKRLIYFLSAVAVVICYFVFKPEAGELYVSFVDVGQGDAAVIHCDDGNILVDAGPLFIAENISIVLDRYQVKKLDMIILSHPDSDHTSGFEYILNNYPTDRLLTCSKEIIIPEKNKCKRIITKAGSSYKLGKLRVDVLSPAKKYKDDNDNSLVTRISYGNHSFLFTGDISSDVESDLMRSKAELKSEVLKVSHHGSGYASGYRFLNAVSPRISVISVGKNNNLNLPNVGTIERLKRLGTRILRTDLSGTVTLRCIGDNLEVDVEKQS